MADHSEVATTDNAQSNAVGPVAAARLGRETLDQKEVRTLVSRVTAAYQQTLGFDGEIVIERQRYSTWLAALASAAFGFVVTRGETLAQNASIGFAIAHTLVLVSYSASLVAIFAAALVQRRRNEWLSLSRQRRTLILRQELELLDHPLGGLNDGETWEALEKRLYAMEHLPGDKKESAKLLQMQQKIAGVEERRWVKIQESAVALAIAALALIANVL